MLTEDQLGEFIDEHFRSDLFRLETRTAYSVDSDGEDYSRYLRGEAEPSAPGKAEWLEHVRRERESGLISRRVNVLRAPLSEYQRYECEWGYTYLVEAGEDVRILDLTNAPEGSEVLREIGDFFLIDGRQALRMIYSDDDEFVGAEIVDAGQMSKYKSVADAAWTLAEPFAEWWAAHPEHHRGRSAA
jgi:hypothetical protein